MVRIENPIAQFAKPDKPETSLAPVHDWRWCIQHACEGPNPKSSLLTNIIGANLQQLRELNPQIAEKAERALPYAVAGVAEFSQRFNDWAKEYSPEEVTTRMLQIEAQLPEDWRLSLRLEPDQIKDFVTNLLQTGFNPLKPIELQKNTDRKRQDEMNSPSLISFFDQLQGIKLLPSMEPVLVEGLKGYDKASDDKLKVMPVSIFEGLLGHVRKEEGLTIIAALATSVIFGWLSIQSSAMGFSGTSEVTREGQLVAVAISLYEYVGLSNLLSAREPEADQVAEAAAGAKLVFFGKELPGDLIDNFLGTSAFLLWIAAYGYDLVSTYIGLPKMGITDNFLLKLFLTPLASIGFEVSLATAWIKTTGIVRRALASGSA